MLRSQMETGVALVIKVRIPQLLGVVLDNALDEGEIVQQYGAAQAPRCVNPVYSQRRSFTAL